MEMKRFIIYFFLIFTSLNVISQEIVIDIDTSLVQRLNRKAFSEFGESWKYLGQQNYISYNVEQIKYFEDRTDTILISIYNNNSKKKKNRYLALSVNSKRFDYEEIFKLKKKDIIIVDKNNNEFIYSEYGKHPFWVKNYTIRNTYLADYLFNVPYYSHRASLRTKIATLPHIGYTKDSVIDGKNYKFYYYRTYHILGENWHFQYLHSLCFNSENILEGIDVQLLVPNSEYSKQFVPHRITYKFTDYSFEKKDEIVDSLFNPDNNIYAKYTKHNDKNPAYSSIKENTKDTILTDYLLDYPIVNLKGDTTTIRKEEGWLLLDFWFFGCKSCKEWIYSLKQQRDSLGYIVLENKGIKIMSINALSDNVDKIEKEMINLDAQNFSYHAKGINRYFYIKSMPYYILISPDKRIVYKTKNLGNYSELLEKL